MLIHQFTRLHVGAHMNHVPLRVCLCLHMCAYVCVLAALSIGHNSPHAVCVTRSWELQTHGSAVQSPERPGEGLRPFLREELAHCPEDLLKLPGIRGGGHRVHPGTGAGVNPGVGGGTGRVE